MTSVNQKNLTKNLISTSCSIIGKGPFGEEFVTAGGVNKKDIDFTKMESKLCSGLYFAGELIDVDGITGGFNFQSCWSTGWLSGNAIANSLISKNQCK